MLPQLSGNSDRVKFELFPPCRFVASPMKGTMVGAAERNRELVADPAAQGSRLHEPQMMSVRRSPSAQQARLRRHELQVRTIAVAARFAQGEGAFVDMPGNGIVHPLCSQCSGGSRLNLNPSRYRRSGGHMPARPPLAGAPNHRSGSFARTRRFLCGAELNTGPEGGHQRDAARRLGRFREDRIAMGGRRR